MLKQKRTLLILAALVLFAITFFVVRKDRATAPEPKTDSHNNTQQTGGSNQPATFDKKQHPLDQADSLWVVVNKQRPLSPKTYTPADLTIPNVPLRLGAGNGEMLISSKMRPSLEQMVAAAKRESINLMLASGYRSYQTQVIVYNNEVKQYGQAQADRESARPGYSEHQTGLAADLEDADRKCEVADCFADLPEGKWLAAHAYEYGFIIRYPKDKESVTGYRYEPWHIRYVGKELATEMHRTGTQTLEDFFSLPPATNY
jgi:D-alanyl-D-alanine carboxypeptidase